MLLVARAMNGRRVLQITPGYLPNLRPHSVESDSLWPHGLQPARLLCPWNFSGKNTRGLPFPLPGDLPDPGIEPASPALAGGFFTTSTTWEAPLKSLHTYKHLLRSLYYFAVAAVTHGHKPGGSEQCKQILFHFHRSEV